jgi:hypothetical protein
MLKLLHKNFKYWTHERSLKALLIYLSFNLFIWLPLSQERLWEQLVQDILFALILLSGVFAVFSYKWQRTLFIALALSAFIIRGLIFLSPNPIIKLIDDIVSLLYFSLLSVFVLRNIFKDGPVNNYRIQGALVFYLLFGMMCAYIYHILYLINADSFIFQLEQVGTTFFAKFLYFSFVIQTTLGIGDIAPVHPLAKSLAIFQAMMGMLYPVIMIARLVSLEIEQSKESRKRHP